MSDLQYKAKGEVLAKAIEIARLLHGFPIGQALHIVKDEVPLILCSAEVVDITGPRWEHFRSQEAGSPPSASP